jgi:hypothetical protein
LMQELCAKSPMMEFAVRSTATTGHRESLKGHDNEADFLGFLQKLVPHNSLTLLFEPFRFWLRIRRLCR